MKSIRHILILLLLLLLVCQATLYGQGQLWGTTRRGGATGGGTIVKTNADGSDYFEVKKEWVISSGRNPQASLIRHSNGNVYGITPAGGAYGSGVIFQYSGTSTITWWHLKESIEGANAQGGLVEGANGKLYGLTYRGGNNPSSSGTLFEFDPVTQLVSVKMQLAPATGDSPRGGMMSAANGKLYGTASSGGTNGRGVIFEYTPGASSYTVKHNFDNTNGAYPYARLIQATNGKLYGTTMRGGANDQGVLFEYDLGTSTFTKLHDFGSATGTQPSGALVQATNGKLYGMCPGGGTGNFGTVFEYDITLAQTTTKHSFIDGQPMGTRPFGGLTEASNGKLYGLTTRNVNNVLISVVIEFDPSNGAIGYKLGATFGNGAGDSNYSSMLRIGNTLYGVSPKGGETGSGVVFSYSPLIDEYRSVADFEFGEEGSSPYSGMILSENGKMYGMVSSGGSGKKGVLYEFDPVTGAYQKKVEFSGANGANPLGELLFASNGKLYGTTTFGGASSNEYLYMIEDGSSDTRQGKGYGVLFEFDPATGVYTKKTEFTQSTGILPYGQLLEASDGFFYGVTNRGGANDGGTIYKYDLVNNQITKLKDLPPNAGYIVNGPRSGLTEAPNGKLYGVTPFGDNANGGGIVYEFNPATGDFVILKKFPQIYGATPNDGNVPMGRLTLTADGMLYGMCSMGGAQAMFAGSIFQVNPNTGVVTIKKLLVDGQGTYPKGSFAPDEAGKLYAMSNRGNYLSGGAIVQYDPATNTVVKKVDFQLPSADQPDYSTLALYPGKMEQRIPLQAFTPKAYGSGNITLPANSSAGLPITYTSSNPAVATVSGNTVTIVSVGTTNIKGVQAGTTDYNPAPDVTRALTVTKGDQTLLFPPFSSHKVSEGSLVLYAYTSSFLLPVFTSSDPTIASVNGYTLTLHKVGTVTITASQPGNEFYNAATSAQQSLTITIGDQTIAFPALANVFVDRTPFITGATASSGLPLTFQSSNTSVATVSGNLITVVGPGTTSITASQAGNANFNPAPNVVRTLTVVKYDQNIVFLPITSRTIGDPPFSPSASATSLLPVVLTTTSDKVTISSGQVTMVKAGSVTIAADQPGDSKFAAAVRQEQTFCINPVKPSITLSGSNSENILLTSSATDGNQWFLNGVEIAGATQKTHKPLSEGVYTVKSIADNCASEASTGQTLVVTGLEGGGSTVRLYPNPAADRLVIELPEGGTHELHLFTYDGRAVHSLSTDDRMVDLDLSSFASGLYFVRVDSRIKTEYLKFLKR